MHAANGVGLAAQQVGEALQLTVLDVSQVEDRPSTMKLNGEPVADLARRCRSSCESDLRLGEEKDSGSEGCLSFPDITAEIERATSVEVEAETLEGETDPDRSLRLLARALQHEVDHLNGILFIDRMSSAAKASLASQLKRLQKETERLSGIADPGWGKPS